MELYTRLIEEGVFIFWNDESEHTYELKVTILLDHKEVPIVRKRFESGEHYFSLTGIGSGDYEIKLNAYEGDRLSQTEVKKCKIKSISQQYAEIIEMLDSIWGAISSIKPPSIDTSTPFTSTPYDAGMSMKS